MLAGRRRRGSRHRSRLEGSIAAAMPGARTDTSKVPPPPLGSPLPSLLANLAASGGSLLIHGSERRLNQPVITGEHAAATASPSQRKQTGRGFVCLPFSAFPAQFRPSLI